MHSRPYDFRLLMILAVISVAGARHPVDAATVAGSVAFRHSITAIEQTAGSVTLFVDRTGGSSGEASVHYQTNNGSAGAGVDYTAESGDLTWGNGDATTKTVVVRLNNAKPLTAPKVFSVELSGAAGSAMGATPAETVSINPQSTIAMTASTYTVGQNGGSINVQVKRSGNTSGPVEVHYATSNGTAAAGAQYASTVRTIVWAAGDSTVKTVAVPVMSSPAFTGSKMFNVVLATPTGAALGTPATATVTIQGSTGGTSSGNSGVPSEPANLLMTAQTPTSISLSWGAASPGANPVSHYKIYRNGAAYATSTTTSYTDAGAANATSPVPGNAGPSLATANTVYAYAVSAVDTAGNEGPQQANATFWVYNNGVFNWQGDFSYPAGSININYADTSGAPESGPADIGVSYTAAGSGFQPYAGKMTTVWDMEGGSFGYISLDLKPTISSDSWRIFIISRLPPGDVYPWSAVQLSSYGPAPVAGNWATYKIPLSALTMGYTHFSGSISGTTLTVTGVSSGVGVDAGGYVTGPGVPAGTYITAFNNARGGAGQYTVAGPGINGSTSVANTAMVEQRTGIYKFNLVDESSAAPNHYYMDNVKFTAE
jgi:hypothetical protein